MPKEFVMNVCNLNEKIVKGDFNVEQVTEEMGEQAKVKKILVWNTLKKQMTYLILETLTRTIRTC